ncbi:MAG: hypothetical protein R6T85_04320 [Egibacteraceae bacterium]
MTAESGHPAVVDRVVDDAGGRALAVLLVGEDEREVVVPASMLGDLAEPGRRLRVDLDAAGDLAAARTDAAASAAAAARREEREARRGRLAARRPSRRRR